MITLVGDQLTATLDETGMRIASLVHRPTGRETLFVSPWARQPHPAGPATNAEWVASWPGGWDVLVPNAGAPASVDGRQHGFHGAASVEPWRFTEHGAARATGAWRDRDGLAVERDVTLDGATLRVTSMVENAADRVLPFVWVEHLIVDIGNLGVDAELGLTGRAVALDDSGPPTDGWESASPWPIVHRRGRAEDWSRLPKGAEARNGLVTGVRSPVAINGTSGMSLRLRWADDVLPYLWLWIENGLADALPEGATISCIGIEPANTASREGLATSLGRGDGVRLAPGERWSVWAELEVLVTTR